MYIMIRTIAMTMRKGWKDTCDVDGQGSFPLLKGCGLSTVASVCKVVWQATATSMSWCLWHAWCVTHIWTCPEVTWLTLPTCYKVSRKQNAVWLRARVSRTAAEHHTYWVPLHHLIPRPHSPCFCVSCVSGFCPSCTCVCCLHLALSLSWCKVTE